MKRIPPTCNVSDSTSRQARLELFWKTVTKTFGLVNSFVADSSYRQYLCLMHSSLAGSNLDHAQLIRRIHMPFDLFHDLNSVCSEVVQDRGLT